MRRLKEKMNIQLTNSGTTNHRAASDASTSFNDCCQSRRRSSLHSPARRNSRRHLLRRFQLALIGSVPLLGAGWAGQVVAAPAEQNWAQWRGPLANGLGPAANPPITWSETKNIKWKVEIPGRGSATPIVWENQIFIQTAVATGKKPETPAAKSDSTTSAAPAGVGNQPPGGRPGGGRGPASAAPTEIYQFTLLCLDRQTGKTLWQKIAREEVPHEGHHQDHGFSSFSPVTDGDHVFAYFGSRGLYCYDMKGELRWSKNFGKMKTKLGFGEASSPALVGKTLVVNWDHDGESFVVALDKETGKEVWRQSRDEETSWSTPFIVQLENKTEVVTSATRKVRSYDLASGKLLWECAGLGVNAIPTPVSGHGMVYAMSGYTRPALLAIRLGRTGDLTGTDAIAWNLSRSTPYVSSPLLYGDLLYMFSNRNGILSCFDAKSGRPHYQEQRIEALSTGVYASIVGAAGRVYLVGRNGATVVIKQSEKLEELATNKLDEGIDASPALAGQELFLRGSKHLYCIAEK
jgi:outer membrane protein assembly factor BamB